MIKRWSDVSDDLLITIALKRCSAGFAIQSFDANADETLKFDHQEALIWNEAYDALRFNGRKKFIADFFLTLDKVRSYEVKPLPTKFGFLTLV